VFRLCDECGAGMPEASVNKGSSDAH
jgi:hypothetical protein